MVLTRRGTRTPSSGRTEKFLRTPKDEVPRDHYAPKMVKRHREDEESHKASKAKKIQSKDSVQRSTKKKANNDSDYDPSSKHCEEKKYVQARQPKGSYSFKKSKSAAAGDKFDPSMFTEDDISGIHVSVVSDYGQLFDFISNLNDTQKASVREIGFGSLLDLKIKKFSPELYMSVLMNFNAGGMVFMGKNGEVIINKYSVQDILGLPLSEKPVELIAEKGRGEKKVESVRESERMKWYDFLEVKNPKTAYLGIKSWEALFQKYDSGENFKRIFVLFCVSKLLSPRGDYGPIVKCARSLEDISLISSYNWCGYVMDNLCAAVVDFHYYLKVNKEKGKLGGKKLDCKVKGCVSVLVLGVIHNFQCANMNFTEVNRPFINFWSDTERLTSVIRTFSKNLDYALRVDYSFRGKRDIDVEMAIKMLVEKERGSSSLQTGVEPQHVDAPPKKPTQKPVKASPRQLVVELCENLMTDEEINALDTTSEADIPNYLKKDAYEAKRSMTNVDNVNTHPALAAGETFKSHQGVSKVHTNPLLMSTLWNTPTASINPSQTEASMELNNDIEQTVNNSFQRGSHDDLPPTEKKTSPHTLLVHKNLATDTADITSLRRGNNVVSNNISTAPEDLVRNSHHKRSSFINLTAIAQKLHEDDLSEVDSVRGDNSFIMVKGYTVKPEHVNLLSSILSKHGDIAANCLLKSNTIRSLFMQYLCDVVHKLQNTSITLISETELEYMLCYLNDIEGACVEIGWLKKRLHEILEAKQAIPMLRPSSELKQVHAERKAKIQRTKKQLGAFKNEIAIKEAEVRYLKENFHMINSELALDEEEAAKTEKMIAEYKAKLKHIIELEYLDHGLV